MIGRRLRLISDAEDALQQRRLFVAPIASDPVADCQGANHSCGSGEQVAGFVENGRSRFFSQINILIRLVRDGNLHTVLGQQLCDRTCFVCAEPLTHNNRCHADQVGRLCICIAENVFEKISGLCFTACSAGDQDKIVLIGVVGSRDGLVEK